MAHSKDYSESYQDESFDLKEITSKYYNKWYWFILSIIICLGIAYFYLKYQEPIYQANASLIIENNNGTSLLQIPGLEDLYEEGNEVDDQIEIMKSIPNITEVVEDLNLDITYSRKTNLSKRIANYYKDSPITLMIVNDTLSNLNAQFTVTVLSPSKFEMKINDEDTPKQYAFGQRIKINDELTIVITPNKSHFKSPTDEIFISVSPKEQVVYNLISQLQIETAGKLSNIVFLSHESNNLSKSKDILNRVMSQYEANSVSDKKVLANKTIDFINDRIDVLNRELNDVEQNIQNFKSQNKLTDITTEAQQFSDGAFDIKSKIFNTEIQLSLVNYLSQDINRNEIILLPSNIGLDDPTIAQSISQYNELVIQKKHLNNSTTELNPETKLVTRQLNEIRKGIREGLINQRGNLEITLQQLKNQNNLYNQELSSIPRKEKEYRDIFRQQQTKEALFLFLLQKREEFAISELSLQPDAKIVNHAYGIDSPVKPKKKIVYTVAFVIGLILPFIFIYIHDLTDTKVHRTEDIEKLVNMPVIGTILKAENKERHILHKHDRSGAGESFRVLIANLEFVMSDRSGESKTILVTSTVSGEGKSFVASNLASYLTHMGHKVVLVGLDLRSPKLHEFFKTKNPKGISHFIKDNTISVQEIINPIDDGENKLDVISAGVVLPNFVEILKSNRLDELFTYLKAHYDYIIVDSAPVGLVSDTLNIASYVDYCLFIARANYLDKKMLNFINRINQDNRFKKINIILNDVSSQHHSSHYGYGYGYGNEKTPHSKKPWKKEFWEYWIKKLNSGN